MGFPVCRIDTGAVEAQNQNSMDIPVLMLSEVSPEKPLISKTLKPYF
jgi:hypothetical protein